MTETAPSLSAQQQAYPPYPMPGHLTVPDYAKTRGCSEVNVYVAIRKGKIKDGCVLDSLGRKNIIPAIADKEWDATKDVIDASQAARRKREKMKDVYGYDGPRSRARSEDDDDDDDSPTDPNILEAKRRNEWIKVEQNTLLLEEKKGKLIEAARVERELFEMARMVRSNMLAIPDRLASKLAAERDEKKVHKELRFEIRKALKELQVIIKERMEGDDDE